MGTQWKRDKKRDQDCEDLVCLQGIRDELAPIGERYQGYGTAGPEE